MLALLLIALVLASAALLFLCVHIWRKLQDERAVTANLGWMAQRRRLEEEGLLKREVWTEYL